MKTFPFLLPSIGLGIINRNRKNEPKELETKLKDRGTEEINSPFGSR
jgi:hypothetical protein